MTALIALASGVAGVIGGLVGARYTWRKDNREQRASDDRESDRTIELLKEQNRLLVEQNSRLQQNYDELKQQSSRREAEWTREKKLLEARINEIERDYRNLVLTVTTMGFCANSGNCANYNPGDRRGRLKEASDGR